MAAANSTSSGVENDVAAVRRKSEVTGAGVAVMASPIPSTKLFVSRERSLSALPVQIADLLVINASASCPRQS